MWGKNSHAGGQNFTCSAWLRPWFTWGPKKGHAQKKVKCFSRARTSSLHIFPTQLYHLLSLSLRSSHSLSLPLYFPLPFWPPFFSSRNFSLPLIKIDTSLDFPTFSDSPFFKNKHTHTHTCTLHLETVRGCMTAIWLWGKAVQGLLNGVRVTRGTKGGNREVGEIRDSS